MGFALRRPMLWAARRPAIKSALTSLPATRSVVARFVAGETVADAVRAVAALRAQGILATVDHLGEDVVGRREVTANVTVALRLVDALRAAGLATGTEISLKLSALGQTVSDDLALAGARTITQAATAAGILVTLDMEDHTTTDHTLAALCRLRADVPSVGVAIQAMLRRTPEDLDKLCGRGSRVRLVKGAYDEPASVALEDSAVDAAYAAGLERLFAGDGYPMVGSHDPAMITHALSLAIRHGKGLGDFELQMLYGIRSAEQRRLADLGHRVRAYVPFGDDWYGYFTRRLAERPANLTFFLRSFRPGGT
ncbi:proline dehydrogenase family protein [Cumulibacter manganitolerans]|uniref:proline dehydrogenase family protein n=1 Tax=Cumulibacter manganitolerans TaxID=1884992 RepID=UPI00129671FE|nr:proline dehydrogenase family protein [Cumulibacter manganitolerans]